jgi:hypothetical protein
MFERAPRSTILVHTTSQYVRAAMLDRSSAQLTTIKEAAEFAPDDESSLKKWIEEHSAEGPGSVAGYCGFKPPGSLLIREELMVREPPPKLDAIVPLVDRRARNIPEEGWKIGIADAVNGTSLAQATGPCSALIVAIPENEVRQQQEKLLEVGVRPHRMQFTTLSTLGAIKSHYSAIASPAPIAVCEFGETETTLYFIDRKGIHPQDPIPFGLKNLEESIQKNLNLETIEEVREKMDNPDEAFTHKIPRLLRIYAGQLRLTLDYYEHQTGRVVGSLFPLNPPVGRDWLAPALAQAVDLVTTQIDLLDWASQRGLDFDTLPDDGAGWFPTLALVADLNSDSSHGPAS